MQSKASKLSGNIFNIVISLLIILVLVGPLLWVFTTSFKPNSEVISYPPRLLPSRFAIENYIRAMDKLPILQFFKNSVIVTFFTIAITSFLSTLAGFGFSRWKFRFRGLLLLAIIIPRLIPSVSRLVPMYMIMSDWGMLNTHAGIILAYLADTIPFSVWLLIGFFDAIPKEVDEAAMLDGATPFQIYYKICLPLVVPGLMVTVIWNFIRVWKEYVMASVLLTSTDVKTLPVALYDFMGMFGLIDYGALMAFTVITMLPVILIFIFLQKQFVAGLSQGALKG